MIIHLEVEWDDAILERFVLVIAQQSIHFALQLNWILQGALEDYNPEDQEGQPNPSYNPKFYTRCLKLLKNLERCVVYGKPVSQELQRLYERGEINRSERELLEQADRRFNALQITTSSPDDTVSGDGILDGWLGVQLLSAVDADEKSASSSSVVEQRFASLDRTVLNFYKQASPSCVGGDLVLDRAISLQRCTSIEADKLNDRWVLLQRGDTTGSIRLYCTSVEDRTLWLRRLKEESAGAGLFSRQDLRDDLTPAQQDRYDFFQNERKFVQALTDLAETLRDKDKVERKRLAPKLLEEIEIPKTSYLPLCNSSHIWRRVAAALPAHTRVFNTKERCPVILYFISHRGESSKDPNLDVAEFLHLYFNVTDANEQLERVAEGAEDKGESEGAESTDGIRQSDHSGAWATEGDEDEAPTAAQQRARGNKKVQQLLRESFVTLPTKLSRRLNRGRPRNKKSVMDRQTEMQPMVQIIEGRDQDADNASVGDGTIVSVERSSIFFRDRILYGDLDEGNIDLESMDRAKAIVCGGQTWAEKSAEMLEDEKKESGSQQLEVDSCMSKSNDDLRQEVFVMQMIHYYKSVFAQAKLPLWLKTYRILSTGSSTGLIEVLVDSTSLDGLKKSEGYPEEGGLRAYFEKTYGGPDSDAFVEAQRNFMQSLAAYAIVSYLLGLKDRHNGNIMIDTRGHLTFIDFGFALGMAPGHEFSFERAPFKLTGEYVDVMGGVNSDCYKEFEELFISGFQEARKNSQIALGLVEIMMYQSNYPCFSGRRYGRGKALTKFEQRLMLKVPDSKVARRARRLVRRSRRHAGTHAYDVFQQATNGYAI